MKGPCQASERIIWRRAILILQSPHFSDKGGSVCCPLARSGLARARTRETDKAPLQGDLTPGAATRCVADQQPDRRVISRRDPAGTPHGVPGQAAPVCSDVPKGCFVVPCGISRSIDRDGPFDAHPAVSGMPLIAFFTGTVVEPPGMTAPVTASDDEVGYLPTTIAHASV